MNTTWTVAIIVLVALLVLAIEVSKRVRRHRRSVAQQLSLEGFRPSQGWRHHVLVLASDIHRGTIPALQYARTLSGDARGVYVATGEGQEERLRTRWTKWSRGVPLVILPMEGRSLADPIIAYIERIQVQEPDAMVTVVMPELVTNGQMVRLLHGKSSRELKTRLRQQRGVIVTSIPFHVSAYVPLTKKDQKPKVVSSPTTEKPTAVAH
jgi:hypothetical protein